MVRFASLEYTPQDRGLEYTDYHLSEIERAYGQLSTLHRCFVLLDVVDDFVKQVDTYVPVEGVKRVTTLHAAALKYLDQATQLDRRFHTTGHGSLFVSAFLSVFTLSHSQELGKLYRRRLWDTVVRMVTTLVVRLEAGFRVACETPSRRPKVEAAVAAITSDNNAVQVCLAWWAGVCCWSMG